MSKGKTRQLAVRLALREEGNMWNAYMARGDTMEGAKPIGSIAIGAVHHDEDLKKRFQALMTDVMTYAIKEVLGITPDHYDVRPAPESERSGHG